MDKWDFVPHYLLFCLVANMSQIRDKKAHRKHIETMNPINAKSVQLVELHAFAYCLLFVYLSESFDFLKISILNIIV